MISTLLRLGPSFVFFPEGTATATMGPRAARRATEEGLARARPAFSRAGSNPRKAGGAREEEGGKEGGGGSRSEKARSFFFLSVIDGGARGGGGGAERRETHR